MQALITTRRLMPVMPSLLTFSPDPTLISKQCSAMRTWILSDCQQCRGQPTKNIHQTLCGIAPQAPICFPHPLACVRCNEHCLVRDLLTDESGPRLECNRCKEAYSARDASECIQLPSVARRVVHARSWCTSGMVPTTASTARCAPSLLHQVTLARGDPAVVVAAAAVDAEGVPSW